MLGMTTATEDPAMDQAEKVRENRLRRAAERQGLKLHKSRTRDPRAISFDRWWIGDALTGNVVAGMGELGRPHWTLDDVEEYLNRK
jgi:hypothetical protein